MNASPPVDVNCLTKPTVRLLHVCKELPAGKTVPTCRLREDFPEKRRPLRRGRQSAAGPSLIQRQWLMASVSEFSQQQHEQAAA
jgi:hypothetical protein